MPTITVDSIEYAYREAGDGGPLVILGHSDASSSGQWRALMDALADEFHLRAFDSSGQGRSQPWPAHRPYSVSAESRVVDALAGAAPRPVHLVGHSAGAMFILAAALRLGSRVASLTLFEPPSFWLLRDAGREAALAEAEQVGRTFRRLADAGHHEAAMAGFIDYWTAPGAWEAIPHDRRAAIVATVPKIHLQWDAALDGEHRLAEHARLECPTLLLRGGNSTLAARSVIDVLHDALPNRSLVEIEGAGHMAPLTHAAEVNPHIIAHLRRHAGR